MSHSLRRWFTLVELIVVITILAILATIAFTSFLWYQKSARESTRISDTHLLEKVLSIYKVSNSQYPLPDDYITITASGTTIGYQWDFGTGVLVTLKQAWDIKDPLDGEYYSYFVDAWRQSTQIMALMEKQSSLYTAFISSVYASSDYSSRYPKVFGKPLGMLTKSDNTPIHQTGSLTSLDIVSYAWSEEYTAHFSDTESITGTWSTLQWMTQDANCKRVLEFTYSEDGIYTINPKKTWDFQVYCDSLIDGWWWILVGRTSPNSVWNTDFWWLVSTGSLSNDSLAYSLGSLVKNIDFTEIMLARYDSWKKINAAVKFNIDKWFFQSSINSPSSIMDTQNSTTSNCQTVYNTWWQDAGCYSGYNYWGAFWYQWGFIFNRQSIEEVPFVYSDKFESYNNGLPKDKDSGGSLSYDNFRWESGMIFIR